MPLPVPLPDSKTLESFAVSASLTTAVPLRLWDLKICLIPDYQGDYYAPGSNYDFFAHGPPSQAQSPADSSFLAASGPGSTPLGALEPPLAGPHAADNPRFTDMISHPDTPSPEPGLPGALHPMPGEVFSGGPSPPFPMSGTSGYSGPLSHPNPELNEAAVW
ncbi:Hypothetical predicted protein [Marmota monax]|uniref:Uncharacterized protein n=1 Tax=Marmota monax TaxID=9995 RepID=A0A5E4A434_MARMO|nr:Hypothetical predicted protein [Marmota monax]